MKEEWKPDDANRFSGRRLSEEELRHVTGGEAGSPEPEHGGYNGPRVYCTRCREYTIQKRANGNNKYMCNCGTINDGPPVD